MAKNKKPRKAYKARPIHSTGCFFSRADTLKNLMLDAMTSSGLKKVSDPLVTVYLRKSTATIVDNMELIPKDLLRVKVETSPDLVAISKTIKSGIEVPGAHLEERQNVNIK